MEVERARLAVVDERRAVLKTSVARKTVVVRRRGEEGEWVVEVGFVAEFSGQFEAFLVEVKVADAVRFDAAVNRTGYDVLASRTLFPVLFLNFRQLQAVGMAEVRCFSVFAGRKPRRRLRISWNHGRLWLHRGMSTRRRGGCTSGGTKTRDRDRVSV